MTQSPYFTTLPNRGLIKISGPDRRAFLQGLISNDINLLDTQPSVYACLLSPQGKFLFDFFVTEKDETITLECEGGARAEDLFKKLSMYKLRANVKIEALPNTNVYAGIFTGGYPDPRHAEMGSRSLEKPDAEEKSFDVWDHHRISLTVPDGSRDMIVNQSTLLECNIDKLNGVSFEKGCYMGQELTARMHHRNLGKKHLQTVKLDNIPGGAELRSSCGDIGIALVKD